MTKTHPNQSRGILISLTILKNICLFAAFPYIRVPQTAAKIWSKDSFFKSAPLIPTASTNAFHSINLFLFSRDQVPTNSVAPSSVYKAYTIHNSSICSDEGLTLETSAFQSRWSIYIIKSVDKPNFRSSGISLQRVSNGNLKQLET